MNSIDTLIRTALEYLWETMVFPDGLLKTKGNKNDRNQVCVEDKENED